MDNNTLKVPEPKAAIHADNMFQMPTKTKEDKEEDARKKEEQEAAARKATKAEAQAVQAVSNSAAQEEALAEFISGKKLGDELTQWCAAQGASLPPVEKLVFEMLMENERKNPDPECAWASPSKYGAAFVSLVEDDMDGQMQVLWGIQKVRKMILWFVVKPRRTP